MISSGAIGMPLHFGKVPGFLTEKMGDMGEVIAESIIDNYGTGELLSRMSNPNWFQAFGATMGMHWNSSGVTAVVLGALQRRLNKRAQDLGVYILGGKGKRGYALPHAVNQIAHRHNLDDKALVKSARLCGRIDNNAIQDGFNLYQQYCLLDKDGKWTAITQGMNKSNRRARRYHWHSDAVKSFTSPHTGIVGIEEQSILNLVDENAQDLQNNMVKLTKTRPNEVIEAYQEANLPDRHDVRKEDVNLARLGSVLDLAYNRDIEKFEDLVDMQNVGPKTLKALAMASEVIHGDATRFDDPARFSFAVGGKDGRPHPMDTKAMEETVNMLEESVAKSKLGDKDKSSAIKRLHKAAVEGETKGVPLDFLGELIENEWKDAENNGGHTFMGKVVKGLTRTLMDTQNGLLYGKK
ncbi:MAG: DUF763 domain-containing protein [Alteromonadaceae bacterium]|nr:DUF763 domain-containing protein [Alteromonadaceae bacterium]